MLSLNARAQKVFSTYPFQFDQLFYSCNILNPAANRTQERAFAQIGYNGFNLISNTIATYYVNLHLDLGKDSAFKPHKLGLFIINDKEGVYLNRSKLMGQYAYAVPLSPFTSWSTGISIGFVNNALKPNEAVGGESIFTLDGDVGTWINHHDFRGGLSVNQIFNNQVPFLNGRYQRKRYLSLVLGYKQKLSYNTSLVIDYFGRTGPELYNKHVLGLTLLYREKLIVGLQGKTGNGFIPMAGVQEIPFLKNKLRVLFSWRIPTSKVILSNSGNAELMLDYIF